MVITNNHLSDCTTWLTTAYSQCLGRYQIDGRIVWKDWLEWLLHESLQFTFLCTDPLPILSGYLVGTSSLLLPIGGAGEYFLWCVLVFILLDLCYPLVIPLGRSH